VTEELIIATIAPSVFNPNGDAENARVLARRCEWGGMPARVVAIESASELPSWLDAVVIGSCSDSDLGTGIAMLRSIEGTLRDAVASGIPVLAVGSGLELLCDEVTVAGASMPGLGVVPASATGRSARVVGELVVDTDLGRLVGYENHARDLVVRGETLGRVVSGSGNGDGREGIIVGSLYGTHLHGPVLAKNPALADRLLALVSARSGMAYHPSDSTRAADGFASDARRAILEALKLSE
jgi:Predicted glutamine amidotransferase